MAFTSFTAVRDSENPDLLNLSWSYAGEPDGFMVWDSVDAQEEFFSNSETSGVFPFNRWRSGNLTIQETLSSDESSVAIAAQPPALTAPANVSATYDMNGLLTFAFDVPDWLDGMPQGSSS